MKRRKLTRAERQQVYDKYKGHCAYCGCELEYKDMQVDHIVSVYANNYYEMRAKKPISDILTNDELNSMENYMPACRQCNFYKSTFDLEAFRTRLSTTLHENLKNNFNYKLLIKYGLIKENIEPVVFYFEKMEKPESEG